MVDQGRVRAVNGLDRDQSGKRKEAAAESQAKRSSALDQGEAVEEERKEQVAIEPTRRRWSLVEALGLPCTAGVGLDLVHTNRKALHEVFQERLEQRLQGIPSSQGS